MDTLAQVKELTDLHKYWSTIGTPEAQAVADRLVALLGVLLNTSS